MSSRLGLPVLARAVGLNSLASPLAFPFVNNSNQWVPLALRLCYSSSSNSSVLAASPGLCSCPPSIFGATQKMTFVTSPSHHTKPGDKGHDELKFKAQRAAKFQESYNGRFIKPLPDYRKARAMKAAASFRLGLEKLKRDGMLPPREFSERPIDISSTYDINDPYVPPEGDGVKSLISKEGSKEKAQRAKMWTKMKNTIRKINKMEKDTGGFQAEYFSEEAVDLYILAHEALAEGNRTRLHELVTSKCYKDLMHGLEYKTLRWRYHGTIEPPRVVNATLFNSGPDGNSFAQVTVRIHSSQSVAIYDRFGRLAYGDPELQRSVIEFVVFEKRTSDTYGTWRMHGKIEPDWVDAKPPVKKTFRVPEHEEVKLEDLEKMDAKEIKDDEDEDVEKRPMTA